MKIFVDLPDELVAVWCPVEAVHLNDDVYEIIEVNSDPEDTRWAFETGARVRCRPTVTRDGKDTILVAYEQVQSEEVGRERMAAMEPKDCPECARLREEGWTLYAAYVGARDELQLTRKTDSTYADKKQEMERLARLERATFHRQTVHAQEHRELDGLAK